jgi:hypothetical protein
LLANPDFAKKEAKLQAYKKDKEISKLAKMKLNSQIDRDKKK